MARTLALERPRDTIVGMASFPDSAVAGLLQWAYDFSEKLTDEAQVEMRMRVLQFVAQSVVPRDPGFDLEAAARGETPPGAPANGVSLASLIAAFRYYQERKDERGVTAAQLVWHLVGVQRVSALN